MRYFLTNILLAVLWLVLTGQFTFLNLLFGLVLGYITLFLTQLRGEHAYYFSKVPKVFAFIIYFFSELVKANFKLAYDVLTPYSRYHMKAGIVAVPLSARTDTEITFLANFITLTPGTLCIDVSDDRSVMYVHFMYFSDAREARRRIKNGFEKRLLEVLR